MVNGQPASQTIAGTTTHRRPKVGLHRILSVPFCHPLTNCWPFVARRPSTVVHGGCCRDAAALRERVVTVNTRRMGATASTRVSVEPALQASGLFLTLRSGDAETSVLQDVSIGVYPGELVVIAGSTPSGPSTLLSCLAGSQEPDAGTVWVGGTRLSGQSEQLRARLRARTIGVVPTSGNLFGHLTVAQNVQLAPIMIAGRRPPDTMD